MMGEQYSWEVRERAEELYVVKGLTYGQVSEATGVSVSQLQRWGADGEWVEQRREYRQILSCDRQDKVLLRKKLTQKANETLDPQVVYALCRLDSTIQSPELIRIEILLEEILAEIKSMRDPQADPGDLCHERKLSYG